MSAPNLSRAPVDALDLAKLKSFDAGGGRGTGLNRRFCCPLCGIERPRDVAHRCLIYRADSGAWNCKRCGAAGKLRDFWEKRDGYAASGATTTGTATGANWRHARAQNERAQLSQLRDDPTTTASGFTGAPIGDDTDDNWRRKLSDFKPLAETPGADYLSGRGIPLDVAQLAGVRFCPTWMRSEKWRGYPAVVFPIRDRAGALVAAQGRSIKPTTGANALTAGKKSHGVFLAPARIGDQVFGPFDARSPGVIICEAPIDALSLATCGFPALALVGINKAATTGPAWLRLACGLKTVFPAFDADEAGDEAAPAFSAHMATYGARCVTLRPDDGAKDWNEALQARGRDALSDWIAARALK